MNRFKKSVSVCLATTITVATALTTFANTESVKKKIDIIMGFPYGTIFTLNDALKADFFTSRYNGVKSAVTEIVNDTYKNESGWWNEYIALPIYFNVLNGYDDGTLKDYIAKAEQGDISQMEGYVDFVNVVRTDVDLSAEQARMNAGELPARFAGAVMYLQAKGIMVGDGAGHINPLDNVKRAEVFKLIQTTCQNTTSYTKNKFYGGEKKPADSTATQQTGQTQMTEQTVLNPNAPAELQYKVSDINASSYKYILNGEANIAEKTLNKEYSKKVIEIVKGSVQNNNGTITFTMPNLSSDYHEVLVIAYDAEMNMTVYKSSEKNGSITLDSGCYEFDIRIEGRSDKAVRPGTYSYAVRYDVGSGTWKVTRQ